MWHRRCDVITRRKNADSTVLLIKFDVSYLGCSYLVQVENLVIVTICTKNILPNGRYTLVPDLYAFLLTPLKREQWVFENSEEIDKTEAYSLEAINLIPANKFIPTMPLFWPVSRLLQRPGTSWYLPFWKIFLVLNMATTKFSTWTKYERPRYDKSNFISNTVLSAFFLRVMTSHLWRHIFGAPLFYTSMIRG